MTTFRPTLTAKYILSTLAFVISLLSFNAHATSPFHQNGDNQHMIISQSFNSKNYQTDETTKMFPAPRQGMEQHRLLLPTLDNEANYMVEIKIGKTQLVDCNKHGLSGELTEHSLKGRGYHYYQVDSIKPGPSTMMECFDKAKTEIFLSIPGELTMKYDSRLPKIFYLPQGSELKYRVWSTDSEFGDSKMK